jgi:aspartyl-tRNA(Asn)/glutamyl-tRNA(Gln) amidotransferase subunit A
MKNTRHEGFGDEVKLRILLGTYVLRSGFQDRYYVRAQKIRTLIINEFNLVFKNADALIVPAFPLPAFKHGNTELTQYQQKIADKFTVTANLAGIPAMTFPAGIYDNLPVGLQLFAPHCKEDTLFHAAEIISKEIPVQKVPGFKDCGGVR